MKAGEAVRSIMEDEGIGTKALSDRMGKPMRLLCDRLRHENISIEKLDEIIRVMGYKIVIMPSDRRTQDKEYEIH